MHNSRTTDGLMTAPTPQGVLEIQRIGTFTFATRDGGKQSTYVDRQWEQRDKAIGRGHGKIKTRAVQE